MEAVADHYPAAFLKAFPQYSATFNLEDISVIEARLNAVPDAVARFHREKGCCDGTDPTGCFRRRQEDERALAEEIKARRRAERAGPRSEFEGTE